MHGGLSPDLLRIDQLRQIPRPTDIPAMGIATDLLWSDPDRYVQGWHDNNARGTSYIFGPDIIKKFLYRHRLRLVCRAHEVVGDGFQFLDDKRHLVTVFSAPNYMNDYGNAGGMMLVDENMACEFKVGFINPPHRHFMF